MLDPRPLKEPVALIACCNKPAPGCGFCFYCAARAHGLTATDSVVDAAIEILERPAKKGRRT